MLDVALKFLKGELNTYLHTQTVLPQTDSQSVQVQMSKLVDESGKYAFDEDSIVATIINIEEERVLKCHIPEHIYTNGQHVVVEPALKLNLYVLFAANFKQYDQSLKFISYILMYFQSYPTFTPETYSALDPQIEKLTLELQSLNYEQINQIWAFLGGKHLPSVIYKVRMVTVQGDLPTQIQPPLTKISTTVYSK